MSDNDILESTTENITTEVVKESTLEVIEEIPKVNSKPINIIDVQLEHESNTDNIITPITFNKHALVSQLLIDILVKNDDIKDFADRVTIKINNNALVILKKILSKAPDALDKVVDNLTDILSDGVIDHKDIPKMIILVSNLYKTDLKSIISSQALTTTEIVEFIQFVIKLVIDLDFVNVKDKVQIFEIIEASGALLEMVIPPQEIKCPGFLSFLPCFKKPVVN